MNQAAASKIAERFKDSKPGMPVPPLPSSGKPNANWVSRTGGLPGHIDLIARHIFWVAMKGDLARESNAIAMAVHDCEMICSTGHSNFGQVHASKRAESCAAVAEWEAKRGAAHAMHAAKEASRSGKGDRTHQATHTDGSEGG